MTSRIRIRMRSRYSAGFRPGSTSSGQWYFQQGQDQSRNVIIFRLRDRTKINRVRTRAGSRFKQKPLAVDVSNALYQSD